MSNPLIWAPISHYTSLSALDKQFPLKKFNRAGVYIWGFKDDNALFWPYYVGKHRNIPFRLTEHASNLKGGAYTLYSPGELFNLVKNKSYQPQYIEKRIDLIAGRDTDLQNHIDNMLIRFHYTYVFVENFTEIGDELEYAVINNIKRDVLSNVRGRKPNQTIELGNLNEIMHEDFICQLLSAMLIVSYFN